MIEEMMQAFIKGAALAEFWLIPFVYRLVIQSAALSFLCHPTALSSAFDSWLEPKPSAGQDSTKLAPAWSTQAARSAQ
ncbi:MAG: hypothetical protein A3J24_12385 [Deltaproteobacteria bacterium RIFCSPLOWO2_02_FULL_53_8]|nr:MAG: hypothetical protein A3J24_12385 [Deltaproteobacteria bacterium RIFCSPLOWO2_02_FULL_53_8]